VKAEDREFQNKRSGSSKTVSQAWAAVARGRDAHASDFLARSQVNAAYLIRAQEKA